MIKNSNCVYCGIEIKKSKNSGDGRSVEHLIPQSAVSKKRSNAQGDFYVCRKCNTEKSKIDALFGLLSRINTPGSGGLEAAEKLARMAGKGNKTLINMFNSHQKKAGGYEIQLPFKGKDIYNYGVFLTKGEYFKRHREILDLEKTIVFVKWAGPFFIDKLISRYKNNNGKNPFDDLVLNDNIENINKECFIVYGIENRGFVFFFGRSYGLITEVVEYSEKNKKEKLENKRALIAGFSKNEINKYCI